MRKFLINYEKLSIAVKASIWFLVCSFLQKGISMITLPVFTRLFTTEEFGRFNVFNSWLSIISIIVSLNLSAGVYAQGLIKFDDEKTVFSSSLQGITLLLESIWIIIYLFSRSFWNQLFHLSTLQVLLMLCLIWTTSAFNFWSIEQRVDYKYTKLVTITVLVSILKPVIGVYLVITSEDKVTARIIGLVLVELLFYTGGFIAQVYHGKKLFSKKFWIYALKFNIPLIPHYLSQVVLNNSDRIMIDRLIGSDESGIYSLAYSIAMIMTVFNSALVQTLNPMIFRRIKDKRISEIAPVAYLSIFIVCLANLFLILVAPEIVKIFAPAEYYEAIYCIPPVCVGMIFMFSYEIFSKFAFYYEKSALIMLASVVGALLNIILNYIFIPKYGYIAAAYTTLICYIFYSIFHYLLMNRICNTKMDGVKPYNIVVLILGVLIFTAVGFVFMMLYDHTLIRYAIFASAIIFAIIKRKTIIESLLTLKN